MDGTHEVVHEVRLGGVEVSRTQLVEVVARSLGAAPPGTVEVLGCDVDEVEYDLEALTTAGRWWVHGTAVHDGATSPFRFFVKVVQSWTRAPAFAFVPEEMRERAAAGLPWRTEPAVYRSDLRDRLPPGLSMPEAYAVVDLDELSAAVWLEPVAVDPAPWDRATYTRAARGLGRLAASRRVAPVRALGPSHVVPAYVHGRVQGQVAPALRDPRLWAHPAVAGSFDDGLRDRLLAALDALPAYTAELEAVAVGTAHGDACARNLLRAAADPDGFVLVDFALLCEAPLGFDLTQLLMGEVQLGERSTDDLAELDELCLRAYADGLADEGCDVPLPALRRAHALLMLVFCGLSLPPVEVLFGAPPPGGPEVVRERAAAARYVLDLVDRTAAAPPPTPSVAARTMPLSSSTSGPLDPSRG